MESLEKDRKNTENKLPTSSLLISDNPLKDFGVFTFSLFSALIPILQTTTLRPREVEQLAQGQVAEPRHLAPVFGAWMAALGCLRATPAVPGSVGTTETTLSAQPTFCPRPQVSRTGKVKLRERQGPAQNLSAGWEKPHQVLLQQEEVGS